MLSLQMTSEQINHEIDRITAFIGEQLSGGYKAVIGISGGLDSDLVARLVIKAIGDNRVKFFTVIQKDMEPQHLENARTLANEMNIRLNEINLAEVPFAFIRAMHDADPDERFRPDGLLDPSRAKCSIRTVIISTYQDRGYVVMGTSNRTELEAGFFLPFGDGVAHVKPIVHLYKTQVRQVAKMLGTSDAVLDQPASAGFWPGEDDIEDLAYWLYNEAPIGEEIDFDASAEANVNKIHKCLSTEKVDLGLLGISQEMTDDEIAKESKLPITIIARLRKLTSAAQKFKLRPMGVRLENYF
ncbi:MAG: NAD(+) synthase [Deferribacteres bacterium]|nr:NAD(+) synthase [candidate division KSB1 bacterium]MCB9501353.1 NAD(+) synthase [Deferribacteres bacterium]